MPQEIKLRKVIAAFAMIVLAACQAGAGQLPASTATSEPAEVTAAAVLPAVATPSQAIPPAEPDPAQLFDPLFQSVTRTVDTIYVQDDYAYLNVGPILVVLDVSDPQAPYPLGAVKLPVETIAGITVKDGYAYVAAAESGLRIVDVSHPAQPVEVGAYQPPLKGGLEKNFTGSGPEPPSHLYYRQGARAVAIDQAAGQVYAYVAAHGAGLRVVRVSDPTKPVEVGVLTSPEGGVVDVAVAHNRVYLVNPAVGLQIVNMAEPAKPQVISLTSAGWGFAIAPDPDNPYVYVAYGACSSIVNECLGGVHPIDVTHPAAPQTFLASEPVLSFSTNLALNRQRLYVLTMNGLSTLNMTDPSRPQVETYNSPLSATDLSVAGERLYLAAGDEGLQIFDLANPAVPALVSRWQP